MVFSLSDMPEAVIENEKLASHTSLNVGGPARWFVRPKTTEQLSEVARRAHETGVELRPLGLGANLIVSDDGVECAVARLDAAPFKRVEWGRATGWEEGGRQIGDDDSEVIVRVGGGADFSRLTLNAVRRGLSGLEMLAGIPGTMGGIIRMNAGGRFGEIADLVRDVTVMHADGWVETLTREQVGFGYRRTNLDDRIVCEVTLALQPGDRDAIREKWLDIWSHKGKTQPLADSTAGCVFKNPPGVSAGELIDRAGLKGSRIGGARVSEKHANFIVTDEGALAQDVLSLISVIRREVAQRFGVELELEVQVWGHQRALNAGAVA